MKVLFVGERPSPRMKPGAKPFEGAACKGRLDRWIDFLEVADWDVINTTTVDFGRIIFESSKRGHSIVALGNVASKALGEIPHFKLPHPSGRNRKLNDKEYVDSELRKCYLWLKERKCVVSATISKTNE